jgi:hypothetical protein
VIVKTLLATVLATSAMFTTAVPAHAVTYDVVTDPDSAPGITLDPLEGYSGTESRLLSGHWYSISGHVYNGTANASVVIYSLKVGASGWVKLASTPVDGNGDYYWERAKYVHNERIRVTYQDAAGTVSAEGRAPIVRAGLKGFPSKTTVKTGTTWKAPLRVVPGPRKITVTWRKNTSSGVTAWKKLPVISPNADGTFTASWKPPAKGRYQLKFSLAGDAIADPSNMYVTWVIAS